jgi:hypothetical protein
MRLVAVAVAAGVGAVVAGGVAEAAPILPTSYAMPNGNAGTFSYFDDAYPGCPCGPLAPLSGGLGDLTDGVIAGSHGLTTPGPYVGWYIHAGGTNPTIVFSFAAGAVISAMTLYVDGDGAGGGVGIPGQVKVNGADYFFSQSAGPTALVIPGLSLGGPISVQVFQAPGYSWVMLSEVTFEGRMETVVPEPSTLALLGAGLVAVARFRRRAAR